MREEMALKEQEAQRQQRRIRELEDLQQRLQEALHQEIRARQDEENYRYTQARYTHTCEHTFTHMHAHIHTHSVRLIALPT